MELLKSVFINKQTAYVLIISLLLLTVISTNVLAQSSPYQITNNTYNDALVAINNHYVLWKSYDGVKSRLFLYDGNTTKFITDNFDYYNVHVSINDKGQLAWVGLDNTEYKVFMYDGLNVKPISDSLGDPVGFPLINNNGYIVWAAPDMSEPNFWDKEIFLYDGTSVKQITNTADNYQDKSPDINDNGYVVWERYDRDVSGDNSFEIFLYNGTSIKRITNNSNLDYSPHLNNKNHITWIGDDGNDYEIFFYDETSIKRITNNSYDDFSVAINDNDFLVWRGYYGDDDEEIFFYDGTSIKQLTNDSHEQTSPKINNNGFIVWWTWDDNDGENYYYDGINVIQLTNNLSEEGSPEINDKGVIAWTGYDGNDYEIFLYDTNKNVPVLLVHGWRPVKQMFCPDCGYVYDFESGTSFPNLPDDWKCPFCGASKASFKMNQNKQAVWEQLKKKCLANGLTCVEFNYIDATESPVGYADKLTTFIEGYKQQNNYSGKFDIVCHSLGALVTRWYMEKLDGAKNIRQWIGIAPVTHGAAIADQSKKYDVLMPDTLGYFLNWLPFIPDAPWEDNAVDHMRTYSKTVHDLDVNGVEEGKAEGVIYKVIVGINKTCDYWFSPLNLPFGLKKPRLEGRTMEKTNVGNYQPTYFGDGVVAMRQSKIEGASLDCFGNLDHSNLTNAPAVTDLVIEYLEDPSKTSIPSCNLSPQCQDDPSKTITPTGINISAFLNKDIFIKFSEVTSGCSTSVNDYISSSVKAPSGFSFKEGLLDLSTCSNYSGPITIKMPYNESLAGGAEANVKLFHWENGVWTDATISVDTENNILTGQVNSLSPFGIGYPLGSGGGGSGGGGYSTGANENMIAIIAILTISAGLFILRRQKRVKA